MSATTPKACRPSWSRQLDRAFSGRISVRRMRALRAHAADCESCRAVYDQLAGIERSMTGSAFPRAAADRVQMLVFAEPDRRLRKLWAPAGALAAAAAALLLWIVVGDQAKPVDEFRARGLEPEAELLVPGEREPGVRLFCVQISDHGASITDEVHMTSGAMPPPTLRCTLDDELQIAYSTPNLSGLTMTVIARSLHGDTSWYAPHDGGSPVPLASDVIDEPLSWSTRLGAEHEPGTYDVTARFFLDPASPNASEVVAEVRARLAIEDAQEVLP